MRILALETSTKRGGAALWQDGKLLAEHVTDRQRSHSELLHQFVESCLQECQLQLSDIDVFATSRGPGSFTGIRVAGNAAKTYSYLLNKPLVALDSLTILAGETPLDQSRPVLALLNAFKNMVYFGIYENSIDGPRCLHAPQASTVKELLPLIDRPMLVIGEGYPLFEDQFKPVKSKLTFLSDLSHYPRPSTLARLAEIEANNGRVLTWKDYVPLYLRASEAEENLQKRLFQDAKDSNGQHR